MPHEPLIAHPKVAIRRIPKSDAEPFLRLMARRRMSAIVGAVMAITEYIAQPPTRRAIDVSGLGKRFGQTVAVEDLSFSVWYGRVAGFLGPNGAGKTTTLRMVLGLIAPTTGRATIDRRAYSELPDPARTVGAALDGGTFHPGRSGRNHLRTLARAAAIPRTRVEEVLRLVDLASAADRRAGEYSLGMRQRLGLASALLGDPHMLVLDEPANGLDPQGIRWLRDFIRSLADEGRAVLISSHVLAEVAQTVDDVVVIARGRSVAQAPLDRLLAEHGGGVDVAGPESDMTRLGNALRREGAALVVERPGSLVVRDRSVEEIGRVAAAHGVTISELAPKRVSLEDVYLDLTGGANGGPS